MLTLPIKKKWFDMILSGEKKEEYRSLSDYYGSRFRNLWGYPYYWNEPREIRFRNGYSKSSPAFVALCRLTTGAGKEEWGAEQNERYYVIKIIEIVWTENVKGGSL